MIECTECKSTNLVKAGLTWRERKKVQRWRCLTCGKVFTQPKTSEESK